VHFDALLHTTRAWLTTKGLAIALTVILTLIALKATKALASRLSATLQRRTDDPEAQKRADTLSHMLRSVLNAVVIIVAAITVMGELGIAIGPILTAAGIAGVAIGFGAQSLVKNLLNGFFILLEDQLRVGDVVEVAGKSGLVERITLRMIVLRDLSGKVYYIPNGEISVVTNMTRDYSCAVLDIGVGYRENVDEVIELMQNVDEMLREDPDFKDEILQPIDVLGLHRFADSAVIIRACIKTKPIKQWRVAREFNRRLKKVFDERGIEIPFPHLTLYMGKDKEEKERDKD
jgi:moderate conductance mechanosensitive channel